MLKFLLLVPALIAASLSNLAYAAEIGICSADFTPHPGMAINEFYSADGQRELLVVSDTALDTDLCESLTIAQPAASILWSSLLPSQIDLDSHEQLILQGSFFAERADVSEIITPELLAEATNTGAASQPGSGMLEDINPFLFGIEERAQWLNATTLNCTEGNEPAGIQLRSNTPWPKNTQLHISASGLGDYRLALATEQHIADEATVALGSLGLSGIDIDQDYYYALPDTPSAWEAITILCPPYAATLHFNTMSLAPANAYPSNDARSAWVWNPMTWQNQPEFFWALQHTESINEFYITVPVNAAGEVNNPEQLSAFIRQARDRGVTIWAVIGDRHDVLPESQAILQTRIAAYRRYNTRVESTAQLAGVQLDIEPYLLPGHRLAKDHWRDRYLHTIRAAKQTAGQALHVDLVMPVWWGSHVNWGAKLLDELTLPGISLTIMNYRTNYEKLLAGMTPFLQWGQRNEQEVRLALESGSLGDELQRAYRRDETMGELWRLEIGSTPILVLFDEVQQGLPGEPFSLSFERVFSANQLSFLGDQFRLNQIAKRLNDALGTWSAYAGIALHGLDEVYAEQNR